MMSVVSLAGDKANVFASIEKFLRDGGFTITSMDTARPWGGFFVLAEDQAGKFASRFFDGLTLDSLTTGDRLSPKILVVQPESRLSWQYHRRRSEIWKLVAGTAGVVISDSDVQGTLRPLEVGEVVRLEQGKRHRLVGLEEWGVVAEIWQHTDATRPSDEEDIVRVQDDFGR